MDGDCDCGTPCTFHLTFFIIADRSSIEYDMRRAKNFFYSRFPVLVVQTVRIQGKRYLPDCINHLPDCINLSLDT